MVLIRRELCSQYKLKNYIKPLVPISLIAEKHAETEIQLVSQSSGKSSFKIRWISMYYFELLDLIIKRI